MQKQILTKKIILIACIAVAAIAAITAAVVMAATKKADSFRSILIHELDGSAVIDRADIGTIDAAENLYLESGDRVSVDEGSMMRMKLDDDKYITAEENTVFSLEAEGDAQDSKTRINLEQGAITNEIQNSLSSDSFYETATPNSVMAVRGTIYRVQLSDDGNGGLDMRLCCFQGTVAAKPVFPDGTMGEEVLVHAGSELAIDAEGKTDGPADIDFASLPKQALQVLNGLAEAGSSLEGITKEELSELLSALEEDNRDIEAEDEKLPAEAENAENNPGTEISGGETSGAKVSGNPSASNNNNPSRSSRESGSDSSGSRDGEEEKPDDSQHIIEGPMIGPEDDGGEQDKTNGSGGSQEQDKTDSSGSSQEQDKTDSSGSSQDQESSSGNVNYKVTYKYQGTVFAVQTVKKGNKATAPVLLPAAEGTWDFNFDTAITADTVIEWK